MKRFIKTYPLSTLIFIAIWVLSFIKTPSSAQLDNLSNAIDLWKNGFLRLDKWAHCIMFGGFCLTIWYEYLKSHRDNRKWVAIMLAGVLMPLAMGTAIEFLQAMLTTYRTFNPIDMIANALGVVLATVAGIVYWRRV